MARRKQILKTNSRLIAVAIAVLFPVARITERLTLLSWHSRDRTQLTHKMNSKNATPTADRRLLPTTSCSPLPVGTRVRFLKTLEEYGCDGYPPRHYATKGDLGTVAEGQYPCSEGHWVFWDGWKSAPFGATLGVDFEAVEILAWKSIAWWPESVSLMSKENTSDDTHHSQEAAEAVTRMLQRRGLGGDGKIFPLKTAVEPILKENAKVARESGEKRS